MINEATFQAAWVLLCERFNREPSDALMQAYYKVLSPAMSTAQFEAACQRIFVEREFFPRPADFLAEVRTDPAVEATAQWEQVHEMMRGFPAQLSAESRRVVGMLGGETKLRNTPIDAIQYVRRDFLQLYGDVAALAQREQGDRIEPTREGLRLTAEIMDAAKDISTSLDDWFNEKEA
jgi:hypothetical protein